MNLLPEEGSHSSLGRLGYDPPSRLPIELIVEQAAKNDLIGWISRVPLV